MLLHWTGEHLLCVYSCLHLSFVYHTPFISWAVGGLQRAHKCTDSGCHWRPCSLIHDITLRSSCEWDLPKDNISSIKIGKAREKFEKKKHNPFAHFNADMVKSVFTCVYTVISAAKTCTWEIAEVNFVLFRFFLSVRLYLLYYFGFHIKINIKPYLHIPINISKSAASILSCSTDKKGKEC